MTAPEPSLPHAQALERRCARLGLVLRGEIAHGGMGVVYQALDSRTGTALAVKTIAPSRAGSPQAWERFLREARVLARLRHPNVVQVHAIDVDADPACIVMELVRGQNFAQLLRSATRDQLLALLASVARATQAVHDQGVAHRDIKPENVIVEAETGRAVLVDFGLALELDEDGEPGQRITTSGAGLGTLEFMSPEQALGQRELQGPASDVWALGVMIYQVLTGTLPFVGSPVELQLQLTRAEPEPPSRRAAVPPSLESLCLSALARAPDARPSAGSLAEGLERELGRVRGSTGPPDSLQEALGVHGDEVVPARLAGVAPRTEVLERLFADLERDPQADPVRLAELHGVDVEEVQRCQAAVQGLRPGEHAARWTLRPGERIGPYELLELIGRGGMGVVHRARDASGGIVALKLLHRIDSAERRARFQREARLLGALGEAEGFVPLVEAGETPAGVPFVVMPFLSGGSLAGRLRRGPLPGDEALEVAVALAGALAAAHARGIVHRDLKPDNVLFAAHGRALVADLGLAKHFDAAAPGASQSADLSRVGEMRGTPGYMSPEQMRDARDAKPAADVFAWGATVYECLTGRPAFAAPTLQELIAQVESGSHVPLRSACPRAPRQLASVVECALARDLVVRPKDGAALLHALTPGRRRRGRRLVTVGLSIVFGTALGAVVVASASRREPADAPAAASTGSAATANTGAAESRDRARTLVEEAGRLHGRGELEPALALLSSALEFAPEDGGTWAARAEVRMDAGDDEGALGDAQRAMELAPVFLVEGERVGLPGPQLKALAARAFVLLRQRRWAEAFCAHLLLGECYPDEPTVWLNRANARRELGDLGGARSDYERFLRLARPEEAEVTETRAWLAAHPSRETAAQAPAPADEPAETRAARLLSEHALERLAQGDGDGAVLDARRATERAPELAVAWRNLGWVRSKLGDIEGAIEDYTRAIELDPSLAVAWANRANARGDLGRWEEAIPDHTRALELDPGRHTSWANRGVAHGMIGRLAEAVCDLTRAIELAPRVGAHHANRGYMRQRLGDLGGALRDHETALQLGLDERTSADVRARRAEVLRAAAGGVTRSR